MNQHIEHFFSIKIRNVEFIFLKKFNSNVGTLYDYYIIYLTKIKTLNKNTVCIFRYILMF